MIKPIFLLLLLLLSGKEAAASDDFQIAHATFRTLADGPIELTLLKNYRAPWS